MKKDFKVVGLIVACFLSIFLTVFFFLKSMFSFSIIMLALTVGVVWFTAKSLFLQNDSKLQYKDSLNNILRTYDSVLVDCDELPALNDKNIIVVNDIYELMDAQLEIKKPVFYKVFPEGCAFVLVDNKEVCVTVIKEDKDITLDYEVELDEAIKRNKQNCINGAILEDIEKTTVIKLGGLKELKVSPIRNKDNSEDIEIL